MNTVQIDTLADHAEVIPTLAEWFKSEWAEYYALRTLDEIAEDFYTDLNRNRLPVRLVAFLAGELVGTIVLREYALAGYPEYQPGLGGLYVPEPYRKRGIGTELIRSGMETARALGYQTLYTTTNTAEGILERLAWEPMGAVLHHGEPIAVYRYTINEGQG
jgi:GNAT superfamily N-acetyltransferase